MTPTPGSPTSRLLLEYEMHLRNTLAKGMDAESYSLHTFEALLSQSMENLGNTFSPLSHVLSPLSLSLDSQLRCFFEFWLNNFNGFFVNYFLNFAIKTSKLIPNAILSPIYCTPPPPPLSFSIRIGQFFLTSLIFQLRRRFLYKSLGSCTKNFT